MTGGKGGGGNGGGGARAAGSANTKAAATASFGSSGEAADAAHSNSAQGGPELIGATAATADPANEESDVVAGAAPSSGPPELAVAARADPTTGKAAMASSCPPSPGTHSDEAAVEPDAPDPEDDDAELPRAGISVSPPSR